MSHPMPTYQELKAQQRAERIRLLKWAPLALGVLLALIGALVMIGSLLGSGPSEADRQLVEDRQQTAQQAEEDLAADHARSLEESGALSAARLAADEEIAQAYLVGAYLDDAPGLRGSAEQKAIASFEAVAVGRDGDSVDYRAQLEANGFGDSRATGLFSYTIEGSSMGEGSTMIWSKPAGGDQ